MNKAVKAQIVKGKVWDLSLSEPVIYVDNEKRQRSGHMSHAMISLGKGKFMIFNSNCSAERCGGHTAFGWIEYRLSEDYCKTFGEVKIFPYAKKCFEDGIYTISVEKAVCCDDGTIVTFCLTNDMLFPICCDPHDTVKVVRSYNQGESWDQPTELCPYKGRVYDAIYYNGAIYVLMFCNAGDKSAAAVDSEHVYRIYRSVDSGASFEEISIVPFDGILGRFYGALALTPNDELIAYAYNEKDETNMDYAISSDFGRTWRDVGKSYVAKKIRNPQIGKLDGQYILHGRAGAGAGFVIYTSKDGIVWDEGTIIESEKDGCYYSNNVLIEKDGEPNVLLVQFSETYDKWCVNVMHMRITSIK